MKHAEILDGLNFPGYHPPFHKHSFVLREIKLATAYDGKRHWIQTGIEYLESNSVSDLKDYCKANGITLVRRIRLFFLSSPECRYEAGFEKLPYYVCPNDIRTLCPTY